MQMKEKIEVVAECLKVVRSKVSFPGVHTTWDQHIAEHVREEIAQAILKHFDINEALR